MAIYAYADETIFNIDSDENEFALGCGIFISDVEITQSIVNEALQNLAKDKDFDFKKDQRTLDNAFFHASEDSKNGHSHFCRSINKYIKGIFDYTIKNNVEQKDLLKNSFSEKIFERCLSSSTLEIFLTTQEVYLIIEKREKLNSENILKWKNNLYNLYEGASYNVTSYKTFYPKLNILLKNKNEPGLQVVDFLIWASNRTNKLIPDNTWQKRLGYKTWYSYKEMNDFNRAKFYLNFYPDDNIEDDGYPQKFEKPQTWDEFINAYIHIEKFILHIDDSDFNENNIHLYDDFNVISEKLNKKNYHLKSDDIRQIGSVFLRMFDTLPIYSHITNDDKKSWTVLLHMKYLASMFVRQDQIHFNRTRNEILRWRYKMQTEDSNEFRRLIYD
ncbi:DUF3800 domain-containing protein [Chryseobacterium indoltheticum]|uniref:DUF3800 domain-containing protein n=1 Tax=Chryseobacterium indoltheticum TaxID=254 RepID=A0A381FGH3_9FLAO|nr:DUF3800 domain-containing protein [Chryseobacterium indoltheticum]SUX45665.1 Uncharacterised protein [Chryseobacterium indoltheticum]